MKNILPVILVEKFTQIHVLVARSMVHYVTVNTVMGLLTDHMPITGNNTTTKSTGETKGSTIVEDQGLKKN
jgi:hypothetical protein